MGGGYSSYKENLSQALNYRMTFSVSSRSKPLSDTLSEWLARYEYSGLIEAKDVTSIFGFTKERSPLYGGRAWNGAEILDKDYDWMIDKGLKLKILLSGEKVSKKHYEESLPLLDRYYENSNIIVITNDVLAKWIKRDYPNYLLEASVIRQTTLDEIDEVLEIYDSMVLPVRYYSQIDNLKKIKQKDRIVLFTTGSCGIYCENQICYRGASLTNRTYGKQRVDRCIMNEKPLTYNPGIDKIVSFDLSKFRQLGFHHFKVLPNFTYKPNLHT